MVAVAKQAKVFVKCMFFCKIMAATNGGSSTYQSCCNNMFAVSPKVFEITGGWWECQQNKVLPLLLQLPAVPVITHGGGWLQ